MTFLALSLQPCHWEVALESTFQNYRYCTKDGKYETIDSWYDVNCGETWVLRKKVSLRCIVHNLIGDERQNI